MRKIEFNDTCVIARETGAKDEWDNPVRETVYEGACCYQEAGTGYSRSIVTRNPTLYLPSNDVLVMINDKVTVTTRKDRVINSVARIVRDIELEHFGIETTRIELKQAQGD